MEQTQSSRWPTELRLLKGRKTLTVRFDDGLEAALPAQLLRAFSPSAEVQGHGSGPLRAVPTPADVTITNIERVGGYAVRLAFSDGHATGYYTWAFLEEFALSLDAKAEAFETVQNAASA
ncbi:MAG: DUF971 domain-containing protein [Devosiaceae bacterium]|nr:DUF971 domain-containing protein [Devosiaceae bacterium MH13]